MPPIGIRFSVVGTVTYKEYTPYIKGVQRAVLIVHIHDDKGKHHEVPAYNRYASQLNDFIYVEGRYRLDICWAPWGGNMICGAQQVDDPRRMNER